MLFYAVLYLHFLLENDKLLKNELIFGYFIFDEIKKIVFEFSKGDVWKKIPKIWHGIGPKYPWKFIIQCSFEQSSEENEGLWCLTLISC